VTIELTLLSRVSYGGREITGPRLCGLLALLAGDLRTGCGISRLVEGVWPDERPEAPTKALQVLVSRVRAQIGADVITRTSTGYRLALSEDQVDTSAVLLSAAASARHFHAGDNEAALAHSETGIALWAAAEEADPGLNDPLSTLRTERASTYRSLVRSRALALSRLGRHVEAFGPLTEVVRERPRDEEALLELLRCEAATAGPAAALVRYDAYRRSLREELGVDPGPALQAGYQQLLHGEAPVVRQGIAHEPNPLLGRGDDLTAVTDLLGAGRVVSIVGAGGLGKTRLAHAVSRRARQRVVQLVPLVGVTGDQDVAAEVASALGVGESLRAVAGPDVVVRIADALGPGPALLVLDNCEQVIAGVAELVRALVSMTRELRVLTTSRAPLGLSSEVVYPLPELDLSTTVELFRQRATAARPGVDLPADLVRQLCGHLDGLPLAVELAAARVRVMSATEIARRLNDRFGLLRGGARDAPQRHHTLHAVVDWSWNLLDPAGQAAMRALSVFVGGFTADAARRLLGDDDVLRVLEHLVDQSLLKVADTQSGTRFRMLETVREFSAARQEEAGEIDQVLDGFLAWARDFGLAHYAAPFGPDPFSAVAGIRDEQDNLLHALRHGLAKADGATVAATAAVLGGLWTIDSNFARMTALADETAWVLSHFRPEPEFVEVVRAVSTLCTSNTFAIQGPRAVRSLVTLRRLPPAPPTTLNRALGIVLGATPEVLGPDRTALDALCDSPELLLAAAANVVASYLWEIDGDLDSALKAAERMLAALGNEVSPWSWAMSHCRIAELCMQAQLGDQARRHLMDALPTLEELGNSRNVIGIRWSLAVANLQVGAVDEAEHWLERVALDRPEDTDNALASDLGVRAEILLARGEVETGLRLWRRAVDRLKNIEDTEDSVDRVEPPDLNPWILENTAVAVIAHARHGRPELVQDMIDELPRKFTTLLLEPVVKPPAYLKSLFVCGTLALALATVDFDRGERAGDERATTSGARLTALAERFGVLRNFQPTMSGERARRAAEQADGPAYSDAVSSYADLAPDSLRAAALRALRARP
jgi:predicted ATPase/DNA-binding SARP family transcriptional activator